MSARKIIKNIKIKILNNKLNKQNELLIGLYEYKKVCKEQINNEQYFYIHTDTYKRNLNFCIDDIRICKMKIKNIKFKLENLGWGGIKNE